MSFKIMLRRFSNLSLNSGFLQNKTLKSRFTDKDLTDLYHSFYQTVQLFLQLVLLFYMTWALCIQTLSCFLVHSSFCFEIQIIY